MRIALLLLISTTAYAGSNDVDYGPTTRALRSPSADALTGASLDGGALGYARDLGLQLPRRLTLWAEAGFAYGEAHGLMFQSVSTDIGNLALTVGARARYRLLDHLALDARLDVGRSHTSLTLAQNAVTAEDGAWSNLATAAVGVELLAIASPRFSLGVRVELGYAKTSAVALSPHTDHDGDTLTLMTTSASIGHLDLGGPQFGVAIVSQF